MKRLLWITAIEPAFDAGGGGQIRQAHLLNAAADRFDVSLLLAGRLDDERVRGRLRNVTEVEASPIGDPTNQLRRRWRDIRWQVLERSSDEVARQAPIRRALSAALAALPEPDVVCVEYIGLASLLPSSRRGFWAITLHNLPSEMARHSSAIAPGRRQRAMLELERRNSRRLEQWAAVSYDLAVAVSAEDAAELPGCVAVVPNGVDTDRFLPSPVPETPSVVFTGALHTLPNRDGIQWFCQEVWPAIRAQVPDATLDVVGAEPPPAITALARLEGVSVHADVPDVVPFLRRGRVAVVPLRIGSGSRLKALEALAAGRPVVGTAIGVGGLELDGRRDLLVAEDPGGFARAVVRCLTEPGLAEQLSARGRTLVEERYSWRRIAAGYAALLEERTGA